MTGTTAEAKITVMGAGAYGLALASVLAHGGRNVALWGRDGAKIAKLENMQRVQSLLTAVNLQPNLRLIGPELTQVGDVVLLCVPSQELRGLLTRFQTLLADKTLVICCKGIEHATGALPSQIVAEFCPGAQIAVLTGPSFAVDLMVGKPTALTLAGAPSFGRQLQELLSTPLMRLYLTGDVLGAQWGGALKNVIAIGAGVAMGAGLGESARAALMTRGFAEMQRLAVDQGAFAQTLAGLSGFGDLILTCTSGQSRNFSYGFALGQRQPVQINQTVEGVKTAHAVAKRYGQAMPVANILASFLSDEVDLKTAIKALLDRPLKAEIT